MEILYFFSKILEHTVRALVHLFLNQSRYAHSVIHLPNNMPTRMLPVFESRDNKNSVGFHLFMMLVDSMTIEYHHVT